MSKRKQTTIQCYHYAWCVLSCQREGESQFGVLLFYSSTVSPDHLCDPSLPASFDIKMEEAKHHSYACYHHVRCSFVSTKGRDYFLAFGSFFQSVACLFFHSITRWQGHSIVSYSHQILFFTCNLWCIYTCNLQVIYDFTFSERIPPAKHCSCIRWRAGSFVNPGYILDFVFNLRHHLKS
jgi:hypothetical protein